MCQEEKTKQNKIKTFTIIPEFYLLKKISWKYDPIFKFSRWILYCLWKEKIQTRKTMTINICYKPKEGQFQGKFAFCNFNELFLHNNNNFFV